jgi:hypothetical protein
VGGEDFPRTDDIFRDSNNRPWPLKLFPKKLTTDITTGVSWRGFELACHGVACRCMAGRDRYGAVAGRGSGLAGCGWGTWLGAARRGWLSFRVVWWKHMIPKFPFDIIKKLAQIYQISSNVLALTTSLHY